MTENARPPYPPFDLASAAQTVRLAEDGWNTRDPERVALAYTVDSRWPSITADLDAHNILLATIIDRMIHVGVQDPRNALQIVNAFAHARWLARKREAEGLGTNRAGGLHEGAVTKDAALATIGVLLALLLIRLLGRPSSEKAPI